ncbi:hypothetical protein [Acinetobacter pollinis]|uniref:Prolipoprotein diacylglyceryl transferase n=1 Tax=Acinetobacter pollinis TaxID=2605270 RepID=A0ABU6DQ71_9GAMM|nr:hypothetical protein [Acinetobacter pollinis]MBF7690536.1 hypothetical protein [Acinetobacter pollinis]MBF7698020.1 hypothetical protein [Acinetobacter pollinis]MEB5476011.1 hypothetical protein [Acinetobacter pollinis]
MFDFKIGTLSLLGAIIFLLIYQIGRWCRKFKLWAYKKNTELDDRKILFYPSSILFGFIIGSLLQAPFNQYNNCKKIEIDSKACIFKFADYPK